MADTRDDVPKPTGKEAIPWPAFLFGLVSVMGAGAAGRLLPDSQSWPIIALFAAVSGSVSVAIILRARRALEKAVRHEREGLVEVRRTWGGAVVDLEKLRRQIDVATTTLREGRDALTEIPELRVGPIRDLLEAAAGAAVAGPLVSRIAVDEAELVGVGAEGLGALLSAADPSVASEGMPPSSAMPSAMSLAPTTAAISPDFRAFQRDVVGALSELIDGLEELARDLERAAAALPAPSPAAATPASGPGSSPAQLVDTLVQTAADGIEDLAAGLMRANELASVAERVTNRATLLALNASLEATRSGGEAFAAIADETRQLAEYAREATDTISRLAGEIEEKVGETITAIHSTSEEAKAGLASLPNLAPAPSAPAGVDPAPFREAIAEILEWVREIRSGVAAGPAPSAAEDPGLLSSPAMAAVPPSIGLSVDLDPDAAEEPDRGDVERGGSDRAGSDKPARPGLAIERDVFLDRLGIPPESRE